MRRRTPPDSPPLLAGLPAAVKPAGPDFSFELEAKALGCWPVAGTDEAGRGPLAGPVVAAAVILDPDNIPPGLDDSKRLSQAQRERLFSLVLETSLAVSIASSGPARIDATDIRKASLDAMRRAILSLPVAARFVLSDGRDLPPGTGLPGKAVVKGDSRSVSIAAASILAKVTRDRLMARAGIVFPAYGFEKHAGYPTAGHRAAIEQTGPCALHRMSFRPLRKE
ncbi:ribonuclease HII [Rhizobiaceae bacterium BDR2-2]|uniref:Ribonuclease HII n=1 Tax=Ectorhizobium quercum TaxID=2965071 RepID=A0AAE3STU1_9HYPH|nr:ribonuclease HII [Ectorhizobium quercum]MCX8996322.1 ribonuclease HII [Ectorhizobium quercum]MCX8998639.1 ribonuclease HII [Ectorhizobium quercum]